MFDGIQIITFSPTQTSERIAETVASGIQSLLGEQLSVSRMNLTRYRDFVQGREEHPLLLKNKIAVFAAPVYAGRVPLLALERFDNIFGIGSVAIPLSVYGNRDFDDALLELSDFLTEHHFVTAAAAAFIGEHSFSRPGMPVAKGRPDTSDLEKAYAFGRSIAEKLNDYDCFEDIPSPSIKGNRPYRERKAGVPNAPKCDVNLCVRCGTCEKICPTGAIRVSTENGAVADSSLCIQCSACYKSCPEKALSLFSPFTEILFKNCSARKEPVIYI